MSEYRFHAINLITKEFDNKEVKYRVKSAEGQEEIQAGFSIKSGPLVTVKYIVRDDDNDVGIRVFSLINEVEPSKRASIIEACNELNRKVRFCKFVLDDDNDVNLEADMPMHMSDECLGAVAFEFFIRIMKMLNNEYGELMMALYK